MFAVRVRRRELRSALRCGLGYKGQMNLFIVLASMGFVMTTPSCQGAPDTLCRCAERRNMRTRNIPIQVMLNEEEFRKLDSLSHASGLSFSVILRKFIMSREIRERPNADFLTLVRAFDKIGSNINQIARKANTDDIVTKADLGEVKKHLRNMQREMNDWKKTWQ